MPVAELGESAGQSFPFAIPRHTGACSQGREFGLPSCSRHRLMSST